jgi:hypothetical protein
MNKTLKTILSILLALVCCLLVYLIYDGIMQPVRFDKLETQHKNVAVQQLKDIRELQVAYLGENGVYTASFDSLKQFYNNGQMTVTLQVGSQDDSAAVAHTNQVRRANRGITDEGLYKLYLAGEPNLVFQVQNKINVRDTLFNNRPDFDIDKIDEIPFSGGDKIEMQATVKRVSGVDVPLFEAKMPLKSLLKDLDNEYHQNIVNLVAAKNDIDQYPGWQVGSISAPNNNAGNWE